MLQSTNLSKCSLQAPGMMSLMIFTETSDCGFSVNAYQIMNTCIKKLFVIIIYTRYSRNTCGASKSKGLKDTIFEKKNIWSFLDMLTSPYRCSVYAFLDMPACSGYSYNYSCIEKTC